MPVSRRVPTKKICRAGDKVHVVVRVRPHSRAELAEDAGVRGPADASLLVDEVSHSVEGMSFDRVFAHADQQAVFNEAVLPTVESWLEGYHGCIFAYGQTGSGKTHTMLGADGGKARLDGVIPLAVQYALERVRHEEQQAAALAPHLPSQFRIRASYVEIYNDELRDLLGPGGGGEQLQVREAPNGVVFIDGCKLETVSDPRDVIALVNRGSERRATGRTNMNEHSSRSHAIFALHLEHRWRDQSCAESGNPKLYKMKTATLNLVDLAGSEYAKKTGNQGQQLRESIAINSGLFALGNVIAALAGHRDRRVGDHIPYRDSVLTRVLQSSLGGDSRTVMIACVSPALCNREETLGTLRYAASARSITNKSVLHVADLEADPEPLDGDVADPEPDFARRTMWIDTATSGEVYARCMGDESSELVLFVHGSGPTNSSTWWNGIMWELALRSPRPLFLVAIDCPGYGRSKGDRQTIRSYPGAFLMDVVRSLGKEQALCLVGSSQGACAVFNAVLEFPAIARHVVVMDPVGHDVFRYKAIRQPCLLIFDTEDDGHPVKVGRWMRDNIPDCIYFEFAGLKEPYWHCDHMVPEMVRLFNRTWSSPLGRAREAVEAGLETMTRLAGGLVAWVENMGFGEPIKQIETGLLRPPSTFVREMLGDQLARQLTVSSDTASSFGGGEAQGTEWRAEVCPRSGRVFYTCDETLEVLWRRPTRGVIVNEVRAPPPAAAAACAAGTLFSDDADGAAQKARSAAVESEEQAQARLAAERCETTCGRCGNMLWEPRRMAKCRHVVCSLCFDATTCYTGLCSICSGGGKVEELDLLHRAFLATQEGAASRAAELENARDAASRQQRIVLEYGNTAVGTPGSAYQVEAFCRVVRVERGSKCPKDVKIVDKTRALARVDFNINPDFPKSAVKVSEAPFVLRRTMALAFTCEMTAHFNAGYDLPPLVMPYTIHHAPSTVRRAVLVVQQRPKDGPPPARKVLPVSLDDGELFAACFV